MKSEVVEGLEATLRGLVFQPGDPGYADVVAAVGFARQQGLPLAGRANAPAPDARAYPHRNVQFAMNVHGCWQDPADDARIREADGANYERLVELKRRYDPDNVFRIKHNIQPGA